jgi:preprotein translocase SecE subunit
VAEKSKAKSSNEEIAARKKRRVVKKTPETVRQKRQKAADAKHKQRRVRNTAAKAKTPLSAVGRGIKKVLSPFSFLLKPFKTRPARFIGRILGKILFINYIRDSWRELRLVEWPDRRSTIKLTIAVFVFAIVLSSLVAALDYGLDKIFKQILT